MSTEDSKLKNEYFHWPTVLYCIHLHPLALYGLWLLITEAKWLTVFFTIFIISYAAIGITVGAHRLWAHASFQASSSLRLFLMIGHTLAGVGNIYDWALKHRTHHKFYGTQRDPYNHKKGFFYSHFVSNLLIRSTDQDKLDRDIDMRDLDMDGYVHFQRWFYWILFVIVGLLLPINAPAEYWDETILNSILILGFLRLAITTHISWLINSSVLIWGLKPGDKSIADDNTIFLITKSYWLNYHYLLPWDWKTGEFGNYDSGASTFFIKSCKNLGLVNLLKTVSGKSLHHALSQALEKKLHVNEAFKEVKKIADVEAIKANLYYNH